MRRMLARLRADGQDDRGAALIVVIGLGVVMMLLVATGLTVATSGLRAASTDQNFTSSLDAAYAGVQDYVTHLNVDSTYPANGNPLSTFGPSGSVTLPTGAAANPAFGMGTTGDWATVPGSDGKSTFRYEVDNSAYASTGVVRVRSTGRVGSVTRTVIANVKRSGFVDYTYFSNYEEADPALTGNGGTTAAASTNCAVYGWEGRDNNTCFGSVFALPRFGTGVLQGAVHSNDTIAMSCAIFNGTVTTGDPGGNPSYNGGKNYDDNAGCAPRTSAGAAVPVTSVPIVALPATNGSMQNETRSDLSSNPGCLYTGPTTVVFNSDGTMTVTSPWTKYTNTAATSGSSTPNSGTNNPTKCGAPGTGAGQLGSSAGATVPQLNLNLLYVQTVPLLTTDPNYTAITATPSGLVCLGSDGATALTGSSASAGWKFGGTSYPLSNEIPPTYWGTGSTTATAQWNTVSAAYGCRDGDLFVKGTVTTQTTVASDNYTYVTGDLTVADLTKNVLGLVATAAVIVWNPSSSPTQSILTDSQRTIKAAILSVAHSFTVQNFGSGSVRGTLAITGSIAQNFRGKIQSGAHSYTGDYRYDPLLASVTPPKFLAPANTTFKIARYVSVAPAFNADGSAR